jgi:4-diphosphocytidyl-2-C-methyl-D-erythritol kinase
MTLAEPAPAKVNLALHVRERMPDGYHRIETLFAFTALADRLTATPAREWGLTVTGPFASAVGPRHDNLVLRAARAFLEAAGPVPCLAFRLEKHLPAAAGLGGGSADAAATLRLLARANPGRVGERALADIAAGLGADVPACLASVTSRGEGRGERLTPASPLTGTPILLANPGRAVPTGPVFAAWDGQDRGPLPQGESLAVARAGRNDLEAPAIALEPVIAELLDRLAAASGATLVRMSGSGATCLALFETTGARDAAASHLPPSWWRAATYLL